MKVYHVIRSCDVGVAHTEEIGLSPWDYAPVPRAVFGAAHCDRGLSVRLRCYESDPVAAVKARHGHVCNDSCMEFFFSPSADCRNGYFNFEVNSQGVYLFDFGLDPGDGRVHIPEDLEVVPTSGEDGEGRFWQIDVTFPIDLIEKYAPSAAIRSGDVIRANVYKCGKTDQPEHYGCWSPVGTPNPNYHTPEYFGEFIIE